MRLYVCLLDYTIRIYSSGQMVLQLSIIVSGSQLSSLLLVGGYIESCLLDTSCVQVGATSFNQLYISAHSFYLTDYSYLCSCHGIFIFIGQ